MVEFGGRRDSGPLDDRRSWSHVGGRVKTAHRLTPQFAHGRGLRLGTRNALSPSSTLSPCPRPRTGDSRSGGQRRTLQAGRRAGARRWTSRSVRYNISRALSTSRTWSPCGLRALRLAGARVWLQQRVEPAAQGQHFRVGGGEPRADPFGALEDPPGLFRRPGPDLDDLIGEKIPKEPGDYLSQQRGLGSGRVVFRQLGDALEEDGPARS